MANRSVTVFGDAELGFITVIGGGTSSNRLTMEAGDVLTVTHSLASSIYSGSITVSTFSSGIWTSATNMSLTRGSSDTRTVKTDPTVTAITLACSASGYTSGYIYLNIVSSIDTTPDQFNIGADITGANPAQEYLIGNFTVSGINTGVTMSCSGTANTQTRIGTGGTKSSSDKTVYNGSVVYVFGTSSSSYNTGVTATVTIGGVSDSATITTAADPSSGTRIPIGITSGAISLDNVRKLFGPADYLGNYGTAAMSNYYFGGTYVPNISTGTPNNSGIPSSGTIDLTDFYGCCTTIYYSTAPSNKSLNLNTTQTAQTGSIYFNTQSDWTMGYGPDMKYLVEYQVTHEVTNFSETINGVTSYEMLYAGTTYDLDANRTAFNTGWGNGYITLTLSVPRLSEAFITGKITLTARHKQYTGYTTSVVFYYQFNVFGP